MSLVERGKAIWAWVQRTHAYRAWNRFGEERGNLLAAGIGYFSFFSLFPAGALAGVVFGFFLANRPDLLDAVAASVDSALPGFVKTASNPEGLIELSAPSTATLSITGIVAIITLVMSGLGWIGALREGIRAIFSVSDKPGNPVLVKLRELAVMAVLGVAVLVSASATSVVGTASRGVLSEVPGGPFALSLLAALVGFSIDTGVMVVLLRFLSGVPLPWRDIRNGAIVGGVGLTIAKALGATLIAQATRNPLFGSVVVVIGLLFWLNLIAKIVLLAASWAANDIDAALEGLQRELGDEPTHTDDAAASPMTTQDRVDAGLPDFGSKTYAGLSTRQRDRVSVVSGAVVGAGLTAALGGLVRAVLGTRQRR